MLFCFRSLFAVEYMLILVSSEVVLLRRLVTTHQATVAGSLSRLGTGQVAGKAHNVSQHHHDIMLAYERHRGSGRLLKHETMKMA